MLHRFGFGLFALMFALIAACSRGPDMADPPPQQWGNVSVKIETRPLPPRAGMNEFLVIGTDARGKPAWNMMVMLRTDTNDGWRQAIQDGESGVFRKALPLESGPQNLFVKLQRRGEEAVLEFPLQVE
ncbi:MAG: hypothetical protein AB7Q01_01005 [Gammaproteobacteria bacterium]